MSDNLICDYGAILVAKAAKECEHLTEIRLQQCNITEKGASEIFKELKGHVNLQNIDLSLNPITEECLADLSELMTANQDLTVDLSMNSIQNMAEAEEKMQQFIS